MRRISSRDRLKMLSPNNTYAIDMTDGFGTQDRIKRVSSSSSISSLGKPSGYQYYEKSQSKVSIDAD